MTNITCKASSLLIFLSAYRSELHEAAVISVSLLFFSEFFVCLFFPTEKDECTARLVALIN